MGGGVLFNVPFLCGEQKEPAYLWAAADILTAVRTLVFPCWCSAVQLRASGRSCGQCSAVQCSYELRAGVVEITECLNYLGRSTAVKVEVHPRSRGGCSRFWASTSAGLRGLRTCTRVEYKYLWKKRQSKKQITFHLCARGDGQKTTAIYIRGVSHCDKSTQ